ncbi:LCP family protein [Rubrobacter radiotolerans]|uniref:LCP family protein n=2 Tax=Rubrobacter radiotolerans TaxID=42256 RepID=A0AB35SYY1_RUBRA|nr:LCP family protein [Rubrobacter radiotolerans]MDX5892809.1 LCP family protein [Rubrobacter radiotolerans]
MSGRDASGKRPGERMKVFRAGQLGRNVERPPGRESGGRSRDEQHRTARRREERARPGALPRTESVPRERRLPVLPLLLLAVLAVLVVLAWPFGGQRVVLLGSDARADEASRSDTVVVAKGGGGMLAVPRDTLVTIPGVGEGKINAALATGGPELATETLSDLTGEPVGYYVVLDFGGVEEIVDALGGITINVEEPIDYGLEGTPVSIPAGEQTLSGEEALGYVRYRGTPTADIGRIERQQRFLQALASEATSPTKLPRLPGTALAVWRNVETNMNPVRAAFFAARVGVFGIGETEIYPGTPQYIDGISYWVPDREAGERVVQETIG